MVALMADCSCQKTFCFELVWLQVPVKRFEADMVRSGNIAEFPREGKTSCNDCREYPLPQDRWGSSLQRGRKYGNIFEDPAGNRAAADLLSEVLQFRFELLLY